MLKTAMLVSALALSVPALAQDQKPTDREPATTAPTKAKKAAPAAPAMQDTPTTAQTAPVNSAPAPAEQAAAPAPQTTPAEPMTMPAEQAATQPAPTQPATAPAETATATPAEPAAPVTGASQIAQVVDTEFPTYDKNSDTNLDKTEFSAWMVALKTASDPTTKASDPATAKWIDGAFASADADKSKLVSKAELTKYLSQGAE